MKLLSLLFVASLGLASVGPSRGTLLIVGGGAMPAEITQRFFDLAGGKNSAIVVIPTADAKDTFDAAYLDNTFLRKAGATNLVLLHTRSRVTADSKSFVEPLRHAKAVWFAGGRQWRLADAYLHTRTEEELKALLKRGGIIGGSSAGATILGSYLVRGAVEGPEIMMAKGHEEGLGFLKNAAIDQHLLKRHRENDMVEVVKAHPELLGIGLDESTAIVVQKNKFQVIGVSKCAIYENGKKYYFLSNGDWFNLEKRSAM